MSTSDGTVVGPTKILDNGPDNQRFNIVFLAEGFQDTEQTTFNNACDDFVNALRLEPWFDTLISAINVHRINVESDDSGADDPATCGGPGTTVNTYFDATYCGDGVIRRLIVSNDTIARDVLDTHVPQWHVAVVLVNSTRRGGSGGGIATVAMSTDWVDVTLHELGHSAFALADEYNYWSGCGVDTDRDVAPAGEPAAANVTTATTLGSLKWAHLVDPLTPVPTMENPDCTQCDSRANVLGDDFAIGLFEGAQYYHCGRYRPAYTCRMRVSSRNFCRVCVEAIHDVLRPFFGGSPALAAEISSLEFGSLGQGGAVSITFEISNVGSMDVTGVTLSINNANYSALLLGGGATLTPGESRQVEVTLGPVFVNGPQNGTLEIASNAPTLSIALSGSICTPQSEVEIVTQDGSMTLDFGEVSQGLTMYRFLEIRNLRTACPAPLEVDMTVPSGGFSFAPGTIPNFTLSAPDPDENYTSQRVFIAITAPTVTVPTDIAGTFTIDTPDDTSNPSTTIQLNARTVPPPVVDSVLVIDRSGSMADPTGEAAQTKIDHAIYAAELYVSLLKGDDRIGLVRYNNHSTDALGDRLLDPVVAGPIGTGTGRGDALTELNLTNLHPTGGTSVGAGIILGSDVLDGAAADSRALIVLTDGRHNTTPSISQGITHVSAKTPRQRVFAVGLGLNQLQDRLHEIATVTNGTAQITGDLVGDKEFILQKLFVQILSDVADEAFIQDPRIVLYPQSEQWTDIMIGEVDTAADFILAFRPTSVYPKYIELWLEAPNGEVIRPGDVWGGAFPNAQFGSGVGNMFFRWLFPAFPEEPRGHIGRWRLHVKNLAVASNIEYTAAYIPFAPFYYSVMAKARSNLLLGGRLVQTEYLPGTDMKIVLEPSLFGQPVELEEPVQVRFRRPDGVYRLINLTKNTHGSYQGVFTDTDLYGPYQAVAEVSARSPEGIRLTRYRHFTGIILSPGQMGGDGDFGEECCEDLKRILVEILKTLRECCDEREKHLRIEEIAKEKLLMELASKSA